jgi:uncharacterized membrane protein YfcA
MEPAAVALLVIMLGAYTTGTVLGFGSSILAVTFGAQLVAMDLLLATLAPLNLLLALYLAIRYRRQIAWRLLGRRILPPVALGLPVGLGLFDLPHLGWLRPAFGLLVTVLAATQLRQLSRPSEPASAAPAPGRRTAARATLRVALLFGGGVIHGLFGVGAPMVGYVLGRETDDNATFRATMSAMLVALTVPLLVNYAAIGLMSRAVAGLALRCAVPMLLGILLGERIFGRLDQRRFKLGVWLLLLAGGVVLTARALLG